MKTFHNGCYAICDVASHSAGMCSDISMMADQGQASVPAAFHNAAGGGPSHSEGPPGPGAGGKNRSTIRTLVFAPLDFLPSGRASDFLFF